MIKKEYSNLSAKEKMEILRAKLIMHYKFTGVFILSYDLHEMESVKTFAFINNHEGKMLYFNPKYVNENDEDTVLYSLLCESTEYMFSYMYLYNNIYNRLDKEELNKLFISLIIIFNGLKSAKDILESKRAKFTEICSKYFPFNNFNLKLDYNLYIQKFVNSDIYNIPNFEELNNTYNKIYYNWKPWPNRLLSTVDNMLKLQQIFNIDNNFSYSSYIEFNIPQSYIKSIHNLDNYINYLKTNEFTLEQKEEELYKLIEAQLPIDMTIYVLSFLFLSTNWHEEIRNWDKLYYNHNNKLFLIK